MKKIRDNLYRALAIPTYFFSLLSSNRLRVLAYHDIANSQNFEEQMRFLSQNFNLIDLETLLQHVKNNKPLLEKSLLITFDDGDYTIIEKGLPILKKYNIPAVLFVITDIINTEKEFWWNIALVLSGKEKLNYFKSIDNQQRLNELECLNYKGRRRQLTTQELHKLENHGIRCCNHSHTHPLFDKCTSNELEEELVKSKSLLKSWGISGWNIFAYPNGNYDESSELILTSEAIELAFLFDHNLNESNINPLRISRIRVDSTTKMDEFKVKVSGLHSFIHQLRNGR